MTVQPTANPYNPETDAIFSKYGEPTAETQTTADDSAETQTPVFYDSDGTPIGVEYEGIELIEVQDAQTDQLIQDSAEYFEYSLGVLFGVLVGTICMVIWAVTFKP